MTLIALVDDDTNILTSLSLFLESEGIDVKTYTDGYVFLKDLEKNNFDLVALDVKMPKIDGLEILNKIRETSQIPVIMVTSKDEVIDEIIGLRSGADDYIKKPYSQRLLLERINVILRRKKADAKFTETGFLTMDNDRHLCKWKGKDIDLTITEFLILRSLTEHPGQVKTREQLIDAAYGVGTYVDDRTIDTHVKRLRKKFKDVDDSFSNIESLYGVGYKYREE